MELKIKDYKCPFSHYSKKYGKLPEHWEKIFRTGFLWREYDTFELQEYMQVLTGYKPTRGVIENFIKEAEKYEKILTLKKAGRKTYVNEEII